MRMKNLYGSCIFFLLSISSASAALDNYTVSRTAPNCACYTDISGATAVTFWRNGSSTDDNLSQTVNIGFAFNYDGSSQTQFRVSTNGFITFNIATNATGDYLVACGSGDAYSGDNTNFSIAGAKGSISVVAPFFDDLVTDGYSLNSSMHYQTSGIAPDRVLTVQWRGMSKDVSSNCSDPCAYGNYNFQVKLYETSGKIEFIYGTMTAGGDELSKNYSCGLNSASAQLLAQQSANTATFSTNAINTLSTVPQANSRITFTRTLPAPASGIPTCINYNFPANGATNQCRNSILSWSACDGVPTAYDVYFGTASTPLLVASDLSGNFYNPGSLAASTTYYWRVVPKNTFGAATAAGMPVYSFASGAANSVTGITSSAGTSICAGTTSTLTVNGSLADGSVYNWTAPFIINLGCKMNPPYPLIGDCAANARTISFSSAGTNRFDVFARGCNGTSSCQTITITVIANSTAPASITSSAGNSFCGGTQTILTATGGTHASGAQYAWYSGSCGGTLITGTSASITVTPSANITYFVKRVGTCPVAGTTCASFAITVTSPAVGNNTISGDQTICAGQLPVTITGSLPSGGNIFTYQWESSTTSSSAGFAPVAGNSNSQNYLPSSVGVTTWYRRKVIIVDGCASSSTSNAAEVAIGSAQCNDSNACTDDVCENGTCIYKCTIAVSNVSSTNISVQGCSDGTVSATVSHPNCIGEWNALLYNGNTIQKSWNSTQGATILWNNVPVGNYLIVATDFGDCKDSAQVSIGTTLSCSIQIANLNSSPTSVAGCNDGSVSATVQAVVCNNEWFATLFNAANATIGTWLSGQGNSIVWNNLPTGNYRIFITDNKACSINQQNVLVSNGPPCSIQIQNAQQTVADCDNNSISADVSALTCGNNWVAYLYNNDYSEVLQSWSSSSGSSLLWSDVSLGKYHIVAESFSGCSDTATVELSCSDNDPCTNDVCVGGCSNPIKCNDNNPCTTDNCDANGQCSNQPIVCTDNNACTIDICVAGNCVFNPRNCNDNNACTTDGCSNGICTHLNICGGVTVSGYIKTAIDTPVTGVSVILSGSASDTVITGSDGFYSFAVAQGGNYIVTPLKNNDVITNNGITSLDISLIRRHVLGSILLDSPYKIIAADATGNGAVTTGDIPLVRIVVLSSVAKFPPSNSRLWEFVSSYNMATNPFTIVTTKTYNNLTTNQPDQNFIGVKIGDVNYSWSAGTQ